MSQLPPVVEYQTPTPPDNGIPPDARAAGNLLLAYGGLVLLFSAIAVLFLMNAKGLDSTQRTVIMIASAIPMCIAIAVLVLGLYVSKGSRGAAIGAIVLVSIHMLLVVVNLLSSGINVGAIGCAVFMLILGGFAIAKCVGVLRTPTA